MDRWEETFFYEKFEYVPIMLWLWRAIIRALVVDAAFYFVYFTFAGTLFYICTLETHTFSCTFLFFRRIILKIIRRLQFLRFVTELSSLVE